MSTTPPPYDAAGPPWLGLIPLALGIIAGLVGRRGEDVDGGDDEQPTPRIDDAEREADAARRTAEFYGGASDNERPRSRRSEPPPSSVSLGSELGRRLRRPY